MPGSPGRPRRKSAAPAPASGCLQAAWRPQATQALCAPSGLRPAAPPHVGLSSEESEVREDRRAQRGSLPTGPKALHQGAAAPSPPAAPQRLVAVYRSSFRLPVCNPAHPERRGAAPRPSPPIWRRHPPVRTTGGHERLAQGAGRLGGVQVRHDRAGAAPPPSSPSQPPVAPLRLVHHLPPLPTPQQAPADCGTQQLC